MTALCRLRPWLVALFLSLGFTRLVPAASPGLTTGSDGTVLKNGKPFRGVGVNYYDCFARTLGPTNDTSYEAGFRVLREHGIPFARFSATGYWPREMQLYQTNRAEYFQRMDGVMRAAERNGIGLIPSLFWYYACVPDLVGEPMDQWGNPASKTHAFMREYVRELVTRYRASAAIWAWEFGNEFNLACDLPNAAEHRPAIIASLGTPASRSARDDLTYGQLVVALREFGREVRRHDPHRLLCSGDSIPREHAWHNRREKTWTRDTPEQFAEMLALATPEPLNLLSIHCYEANLARVGEAASVAAKLGKPLFVGEFQVVNPAAPVARKSFEDFLASLEKHRVPLAAVWVFDFAAQQREWSITATNERAWQLGALRDWNRKLAAAPAQATDHP